MLSPRNAKERARENQNIKRIRVISVWNLHPELQYVEVDTTNMKIMSDAWVAKYGVWKGHNFRLLDCKAQEPNNCFFVSIWAILMALGVSRFTDDLHLRCYCIHKFEEASHEDDLEINAVLKEMEVKTKEQALRKLKNHCFMDTLSGHYLLRNAKIELPYIISFSCKDPKNLKGRGETIDLALEPGCLHGTIPKVAAICCCPYSVRGTTNNHFVVVCAELPNEQLDYFDPHFMHHARSYGTPESLETNSDLLKKRFPDLKDHVLRHYSDMPNELAISCIKHGIEKANIGLEKLEVPGPILNDLSDEAQVRLAESRSLETFDKDEALRRQEEEDLESALQLSKTQSAQKKKKKK